MDPATFVLAVLMLFIIPALYFTRSSYREKQRIASLINLLPGPKAYPLIGTIAGMLVPREQFWQTNRKRTDKFAPLFRTWMGTLPQIHIMKPEHLEVVLSSSENISKGKTYKFLVPWLGQGLLTSTGATWHRNRKLITPTFHFKILDQFVEVFVEKSQQLVDHLRAKADKQVFDIYPFITYCALDIICETAMGVQVNAMTDKDSPYVRAIYKVSEIALKRAFRPWLHPEFTFNMSALGREFHANLRILHSFTKKVIRERMETKKQKDVKRKIIESDDDTFGKKKRMAFLDLLLETAENGARSLTEDDIRAEVDTFMFEGHDTTTAGICWSLFLLGNYPEVQNKAFQELDDLFLGEDREITSRDLAEMKYLERVIKEALRLYPSVPFISRTLTQDIVLDNYKIPASTAVNLHLYDCLRDPNHFPEPEKFDPDRFLPERTRGRHPFAYVPFSAGPRNCIGQKFAVLEEKTMLASILRNYKVKSVETQNEIKLISELILRPYSGVNLILEPRTPSK